MQIWTVRFASIMRSLESNSDNFYQLAEAEALNFADCQKANLYYQFFPQKFPDREGIVLTNKIYREILYGDQALSPILNGVSPSEIFPRNVNINTSQC